MDGPACPLCGDDTHTVKVSAIYRLQSGSPLATLLAPPPEPQNRGVFTWLGGIIGALALAYLLVKIGSDMYGPPMDLATLPVLVAAFCIPWIIGQVIDRALLLPARRRYQRELRRWDSALYCTKHDVVFGPDTPRPASPLKFAAQLRG